MSQHTAKTFTGARAIVKVTDVNGKAQIVGVFDSCTWAVNHGLEPLHMLGRYNPQEIAINSYEAVTVNCSGFRLIDNGPHVGARVPKLEDLLNFQTVDLSITDRQSGSTLLIVSDCVPINYSTQINARATSRIQITYTGIVAADESGAQEDGVIEGASGSLPAVNFTE